MTGINTATIHKQCVMHSNDDGNNGQSMDVLCRTLPDNTNKAQMFQHVKYSYPPV